MSNAHPRVRATLLAPVGWEAQRRPLFCLFGTGVYQPLAQELAPDHAVYGVVVEGDFDVPARWWRSQSRARSVEALAELYLSEIRCSSGRTCPGRCAVRCYVAVAAACAGRDEPIVLRNPQGFEGVAFDVQATLEIKVSERVARRMPLAELHRGRITQEDFPALVAHIRAENDAEFGPGASSPQPQ